MNLFKVPCPKCGSDNFLKTFFSYLAHDKYGFRYYQTWNCKACQVPLKIKKGSRLVGICVVMGLLLPVLLLKSFWGVPKAMLFAIVPASIICVLTIPRFIELE